MKCLDFGHREWGSQGKHRAQLWIPGEISRHPAHACGFWLPVVWQEFYYLSTLAMGCNGSAIWRAHKKGAWTSCPSWYTNSRLLVCLRQVTINPNLPLMSESLRNDGRIWVPKTKNEDRKAVAIPEEDRDYYLGKEIPLAFGNLAPREYCFQGRATGTY